MSNPRFGRRHRNLVEFVSVRAFCVSSFICLSQLYSPGPTTQQEHLGKRSFLRMFGVPLSSSFLFVPFARPLVFAFRNHKALSQKGGVRFGVCFFWWGGVAFASCLSLSVCLSVSLSRSLCLRATLATVFDTFKAKLGAAIYHAASWA